MNDIMTLTAIRDEIYAAYETAKKRSGPNHQWSGLLAALRIVERNLEDELRARDKYPIIEQAQ